MKLSQRLGVVPLQKTIQLESLDSDLRNGLWNIFNEVICRKIDLTRFDKGLSQFQLLFAKYLWHNIYKKPTDVIPWSQGDLYNFFRAEILSKEWYRALELIEETVGYCSREGLFPDKKI